MRNAGALPVREVRLALLVLQAPSRNEGQNGQKPTAIDAGMGKMNRRRAGAYFMESKRFCSTCRAVAPPSFACVDSIHLYSRVFLDGRSTS